MILRLSWLLATTIIPYAFADVEFTSPAAGVTVSGPTISIQWQDSGSSPPISDLVSYQLFLCAGGNAATDFIQLATLVPTGKFTDGNSASGDITAGLGASVKNAYFLKIISAATGGSIINYSPRFSISGMTGTFPPNVQQGIAGITGTTGPATENDISNAQQPGAGAGGAQVAGGSYTVAYTLQTDPSRYAPMPPMAVTKITAKNASPQWPTSSYTPYAGPAGTPNAVTTNTATLTFKAISIENTVSGSRRYDCYSQILTLHRLLLQHSRQTLPWPGSLTDGGTEWKTMLYKLMESLESRTAPPSYPCI